MLEGLWNAGRTGSARARGARPVGLLLEIDVPQVRFRRSHRRVRTWSCKRARYTVLARNTGIAQPGLWAGQKALPRQESAAPSRISGLTQGLGFPPRSWAPAGGCAGNGTFTHDQMHTRSQQPRHGNRDRRWGHAEQHFRCWRWGGDQAFPGSLIRSLRKDVTRADSRSAEQPGKQSTPAAKGCGLAGMACSGCPIACRVRRQPGGGKNCLIRVRGG
jgi:hypothetical protein